MKISCTEGKGKIVSLMGASGAGKTTLMKIVLGIESPIKGRVIINPKKMNTSYVPQDPVLFDHLSPLENAKLFKRVRNQKKFFDDQLFRELSESLDLQNVLETSKKVSELSGGQRQRLSLLRAMSINPMFLLLDEPCTGLDSEVKRVFLIKLRELASKYNLLVLYITHNIEEAKLISDEVLYLQSTNPDGIINRVSHSSFSEFFSAPPTLEAARNCYFPGPITITGKLNNGNEFVPEENGGITLLLKEENIKWGNRGIPVKYEMGSNYLMFFRELVSNQIFSIKNQNSQNFESQFVINGKVIAYNDIGNFIEVTTLEDNKIVYNE